MPLVDRPFAETFDFARPIVADYRDQAGGVRTAVIDVPRFDHDAAGVPLGLLVETGPVFGQADRLRIEENDDWHEHELMTVLHALRLDGAISYRAYYTLSAVAAVNACLNSVGHHVAIGAFAGYLKNRAGFVWYGNRKWRLLGLVGTGTSADEALGDTADRPLLGG